MTPDRNEPAPAEVDPGAFRALFESAPGLYLVVQPDLPRYTIVAASDAYLTATMTERKKILGRSLFDVFPDNPDDLTATGTKNLRASFERVLHHKAADIMAVQKYDIRKPESEGGGFEERYWSPVNSPVRGPGGEVLYIIHRVEDVTGFVRLQQQQNEQVQANDLLRERAGYMEAEIFQRGQELQDTNRRLREANVRLAALGDTQVRTLFDFMPQLGWTARPDGFVDFYNRRWYEYTGTTFEQMQGWGWKSVPDPEILPQVIAAWQHSIGTGQQFEMEFPLRRHDGAFRWFLTRVTPIRGPGGEVMRWIGINTDIHDRRQAGATTETRLKLLFESIRDYAVFMLDPNGIVTSWNPGAERIKQYRPDEIVGRHFSAFYPEEDVRAGKCEHELAGASATGRFEDEGWRVRKDGLRFWANVVISAVRDEQGQVIGFSKVTRDLTERKKAEEERVRLAKAHEAIKLRDEFLSIASHELKTPLTTLRLQLHSIARRLDELDDKLVTKFQRATRSSDRLTSLVEMLFDVSRISAGHLTLHPESFDLAAALQNMTDGLQEDAQAAGCRVDFRAAGPVFGTWDRVRLEQVLTNLLSNAFKYASGRPVEVTVGSAEGSALLTVTDHGSGVAVDDLPRIFNRFERAAPSANFGGLGLGLYITKQIVEAHGGTIEASSKLGAGTSFRIRLPLNPVAVADQTRAGGTS